MLNRIEQTPRRGRPRRVLLLAGFAVGLLACLAGPAPSARADACSDCGPPTLAQLAAEPSFALEVRSDVKDYYEVDGGECKVDILGAPRVHKLHSWLQLRGQGEIWNCPHSSSSDQIVATAEESDSRGWSVTATSGVKIAAFGAGLELKLSATVNASVRITRVTTISKTIQAAYCHRISWQGWFDVATYMADVDVVISRRFAWWTKNPWDVSKVHRSGSIWIPCGSGVATLDTMAPISGHFHLRQSPCADPSCAGVKVRDLGFFPPLLTEADEEPGEDEPAEEPGEDEPTEDDLPDVEEPLPPSNDLPDPPAGESPSPFDEESEEDR